MNGFITTYFSHGINISVIILKVEFVFSYQSCIAEFEFSSAKNIPAILVAPFMKQ